MTATAAPPATRHAAAREARRGFFGIAIYHPKTEANVGSLWRSASLYGAAFLGTVGRRYKRQASDTEGSSLHTPLMHFTNIGDLLSHLPDSCPLIGVEQDPRARDLFGFAHPERALYLLGAEDYGLPPHVLAMCHHIVEIPTPTPRSMNVASAGAIVIADRYRQRTCSRASR